jgi:glutathione synthase/RimK-type ligase-like ATP-grasp enzyme
MFDATIATHGDMPDGSTDDRLLADSLAAAGARVRLSVWNDPAVDWAQSGRIVIRSTWDYHLDPVRWFRWLSATSGLARLINDSGVVRWNSDKRYLLDLQRAGVPIVPTELVTRERGADLGSMCAARGWRDIVVKPAIGASAQGAERFTDAALTAAGGAAQAHLDALLIHGHALVQPFQEAVNDARERSLVYIGGAFSHAFSKPPFLRGVGDGLGEQRHEPGAAEKLLAAHALEAVPGETTYARVDVVPTPDGPRLMELELIEPDLGLRLAPDSIARLAAAILEVPPASRRLARRGPMRHDAET